MGVWVWGNTCFCANKKGPHLFFSIIIVGFINHKYRVLMSFCQSVCVSICLSVCAGVQLSVCLSVCVHDNSKIICQTEHIVVYENSSTSSTFGIVRSRSGSRPDFEFILHLPQYKLLSPISQLLHLIGSCN